MLKAKVLTFLSFHIQDYTSDLNSSAFNFAFVQLIFLF